MVSVHGKVKSGMVGSGTVWSGLVCYGFGNVRWRMVKLGKVRSGNRKRQATLACGSNHFQFRAGN